LNIDSGSIFIWDEREACMRRWTDGRAWSASRVLGNFLTYKELKTKRRPPKSQPDKKYSYKENGLMKQSFSIVTTTNQRLHLISYYKKQDILSGRLKRPSEMFNLEIPEGIYPDLIQPLERHDSIDSTCSSNNSTIESQQSTPCSGNASLPLPDSYSTCQRLPIQDIAWDKLPSTEDIRQLNALKNQLRIW
jgi:hypothetical protein